MKDSSDTISHPWSRERITIQPYYPKWPQVFEKEKQLLQQHLKSHFLTLHHIGSTAVPGLGAKPIIDMILVIRHQEEIAKIISLLQEEKYHHLGKVISPRTEFFLKKESSPPQYHRFHLHTYVEGDSEIERHLLFREQLRNHPQKRNDYEQLKKQLAYHYYDNREKYNQGKTSWIRQQEELAGIDSSYHLRNE